MTTLILITCFFCGSLGAPPAPSATIFASDGINPYDALWNATTIVESGKNAFAVGDKHLIGYSYGIAQIRQVRLDDYYQRTGIRYDVTDMYDTIKSKQIFMWYASQMGPYNMETIARRWNGSGEMTKIYWKKIKRHL